MTDREAGTEAKIFRTMSPMKNGRFAGPIQGGMNFCDESPPGLVGLTGCATYVPKARNQRKRQLGLADAAVSSSEIHGGTSDDSRRKQLAQTIGQLGTRSWDQHWPRRWPRFTCLAAVTPTIFGAVLIIAYFVEKAAA